MRDSLIIVGCFVLGVIVAVAGLIPESFNPSDYTTYMLYLLLFCIGLGLGMDKDFFASMKTGQLRHLLLPVATIIGTFFGCALAFVVLSIVSPGSISLLDTVAAGSGFGYYSLSSIMIQDVRGPELATIALAANLLREILTLLCAPLISKVFGPHAVVAAGGATSMDTTMGVAVKAGGSSIAPVALYHGFVLTVAVPFIVTLILGLY